MKAGMYAEIAVGDNVSGSAGDTIKGNDGGQDNFGIRHGSVNFSGSWGRIDAGMTTNSTSVYEAKDGTAAYDPAGNNLISRANFRNAATGANVTGVQTAFNSFTYSRSHLIKYTSPKIGPGLQVKVDFGQNEAYSGQIEFGSKVGAAAFKFRTGYRSEENRSGFDQWYVNGSVKMSQGTSISLTFTERDFNADGSGGLTSSYWHARLGHNFGNNTVALGYYNSEDMVAVGDEGTEWSATFLHKINKARVHLYATYSNFEYDSAVATNDIDQFIVGSRIFF